MNEWKGRWGESTWRHVNKKKSLVKWKKVFSMSRENEKRFRHVINKAMNFKCVTCCNSFRQKIYATPFTCTPLWVCPTQPPISLSINILHNSFYYRSFVPSRSLTVHLITVARGFINSLYLDELIESCESSNFLSVQPTRKTKNPMHSTWLNLLNDAHILIGNFYLRWKKTLACK